MAKNELDKALQDLHQQIEDTPDVSEDTREMLRSLQGDIHEAIKNPDHHPTLRERLDEAVTHLESDHPALTAAISSVVNALSNMGV